MPYIPEEEIERLKRETDLAGLIRSGGVALKRQGRNLLGLCPFHSDTTASLSVDVQKNLWHCFGCEAGGSAIDWVMQTQHVGFQYAVEILREKNGGVIVSQNGRPTGKPKLSSPLEMSADDQRLLGQVFTYYHATLKKTPEALAYLAGRGIGKAELIEEFRIGFADRSLGLRVPWRKRGDKEDLRSRLTQMGIFRQNGREHFHGSVVFPIMDENGVILGAYGRKISSDLHKGTALHLYLPGPHRGFFNPRCLISPEVILCEAIIDASSFWAYDFRNVTASYGTGGFTEEMFQAFLGHGIRRVYNAYDPDEAGDTAAEQLATRLIPEGIECLRLVFPPGLDANAFVCADPTHAGENLTHLIQIARPMGNGNRVLFPSSFSTEEAKEENQPQEEAAKTESTVPFPSLAVSSDAAKEEKVDVGEIAPSVAQASSPSLAAIEEMAKEEKDNDQQNGAKIFCNRSVTVNQNGTSDEQFSSSSLATQEKTEDQDSDNDGENGARIFCNRSVTEIKNGKSDKRISSPSLAAIEETAKEEKVDDQENAATAAVPSSPAVACEEAAKEEKTDDAGSCSEPSPSLAAYEETAKEEKGNTQKEATSAMERSCPTAVQESPIARQVELMTRWRDYFHQRLSESSVAQEFLRQQGLFSPELVDYFKIGFDDGRINDAISADGIEEMRQMGLINEKDHSRFYQCLTVGLEDGEGHVVSLYGRRISTEKGSAEQFPRGHMEGILNARAFGASREMIIGAGVWEAFTIWEMGWSNVSCVFSDGSIPALLVDQLSRYGIGKVYLAMGNGRASAMGARLAQLGIAVLQLHFPAGINANELLIRHGKKEAHGRFEAMLADAQPVEPDAEQSTLDIEWQGSRGRIRTALLEYEIEVIAQERGVLRVLLTARHEGQCHTDKLDLYRSQSRGVFAQTVAQRFGMAQQAIERELEEILTAIRPLVWVKSQGEGKAPGPEPSVVESTEERERALAWLKDPHFFAQIPRNYDILGYVGEDLAKQLIYCCASSRKQSQTLSAVIRAISATGKSDLMIKTAMLMPPEDVLYLSEVSKQALYYLTTERIQHKLVIVDERRGSEEADYAIRTLLSRGELRKAVAVKGEDGTLQTMIHTVKGPISYLESTADTLMEPENENRCIAMYLDESQEQTRRIQQAQRDQYTQEGRRRHRQAQQVIARHQAAQRLLKPCCVDIEYVALLTFPDQWCRTRRDFPRFLLLLSTIAYLHQYQRRQYQENGRLVVVAEPADYELAYHLAPALLQPAVSDLGVKHTDLLEGIDRLVEEQAEKMQLDREDVIFSRAQIAQFIGWPHYQVRNHLAQLVEMEYLIQIGSSSKGITYKYRRNYNSAGLANPIHWLITPEKLKEELAKREAQAVVSEGQSDVAIKGEEPEQKLNNEFVQVTS